LRRFKIPEEKTTEEVNKQIWISDINVWSYGPLTSINFSHLPPGLVLIYGPNEAGKTLLMESILKSILILSGDFNKNDRIDSDPNSKIVINKKKGDNLESFTFPEDRKILTKILEMDLKNQPLDRIFRNTFIIRNSDLNISEEKSYFSTVSNIVMGWDYDDLDNVKINIRNFGRLTKESSSIKSSLINRGSSKIKDLRKNAIKLINEISKYSKEYKEEDFEKCEIEILELKKQMKENKNRIKELRNIENKSKYVKSKHYIDKFIDRSQKLEPLKEFHNISLEKLNLINNNIDDSKSKLIVVESTISGDTVELKKSKHNQEEIRVKLEELDQKRTDFDILSKNLEGWSNFSDNVKDAQNNKQYINFCYIFAVIALITLSGSIVSLILGLDLIGFIFMIFGIIFGLMISYDLRKYFKYSTMFRRIQTIIYNSNKVGINIFNNDKSKEEISEIIKFESVPTLIYWLEEIENEKKEYYELYSNLKLNFNDATSRIKVIDENINRNKKSEEEYNKSIDQYQEEKQVFLNILNATDDDDFNSRYNNRKILESKIEKYESHLQEFFGSDTKTIEQWQLKLTEKYEKYKDKQVEVVENLSEIHKEQEEIHNKIEDDLPQQIEGLSDKLLQHRKKLDSFAKEQNSLKLIDFKIVDENLEVNTIYQLEELFQKVNELITLIENDKELALLALEIFEEIEKEETDRIIKLFKSADISYLFNKITNERYTDVIFTSDYEKEKKYLKVKKKDGHTLLSHLLSLGTRDQLLFSIRFALAKKLLKGNLGFFLIDDAFITSDPKRLKNQFEILKHFAEEGWQIIYFSNKEEILKIFEDDHNKSIFILEQLE